MEVSVACLCKGVPAPSLHPLPLDPLAVDHQFSRAGLPSPGLCHLDIGRCGHALSPFCQPPLMHVQMRVVHNDFVRYNLSDEENDDLGE